MAPVPLTVFRSNWNFDQNMERSSLKWIQPITTKICTLHDSYTVVTCTIFFLIGWIHFKLERSIFWSKFEFDRNIVSGTGACVWMPVCYIHCTVLYCQVDTSQYWLCKIGRNNIDLLSEGIFTNLHIHIHKDVMQWRRFLHYWTFVEGNQPVTHGFPSQKDQLLLWGGGLVFT